MRCGPKQLLALCATGLAIWGAGRCYNTLKGPLPPAASDGELVVNPFGDKTKDFRPSQKGMSEHWHRLHQFHIR